MTYVLLHDSLGEIKVPAQALYGAQTQRAIENFQFSPFRFQRPFLAALGLIKKCAAEVNGELGALPLPVASAITQAAEAVENGAHDDQFPLDIFQTGSGTSTNMNANEVIATLASRTTVCSVHPNDQVNLGQSSNDVIPSAIHISAAREVKARLLPAVYQLANAIATRARELTEVVKTGRTHLMDAVPMRMSQELSGWEAQLRIAGERIESSLKRIFELPLGGTAIGTGLNADPRFGPMIVQKIAAATGLPFIPSRNRFAAISSQDASLELSAQLRGLSASLFKIANDLRWMNSGPVSGLAEISLQALQPGSSIMPGKVNPVIPEAVAMICAQVAGADATILIAAEASAFQLNTMLPVIAWNLLNSIHLLSGACTALASKAIAGFVVNKDHLKALASKNPILVTALAPRIGHELSAEIEKEVAKGRDILEVASEKTSLSKAELREILDPLKMC